MFPIAFTTFYGLAAILEKELHDFGYPSAVTKFPNLVILPEFSKPSRQSENLPDVCSARTARRMLNLIVAGECDSLRSLIYQFELTAFENLLRADQTFGVFCERTGRHEFKSPDVGRELGAMVRNRFRDRRFPAPEVDLKNPQQRIYGEIHGRQFFFGVELMGEMDAARTLESSEHHAPINPSIAAAMVRFSSFAHTGVILDPMAGSGTILREAGICPTQTPRKLLLAGERFQSTYERLRLSFGNLPSQCELQVFHGDAANLAYIEKDSVPLIVTNPPYGIRIGTPEVVDELYANFAKASSEKGVKEIVGITSRKRSWMESMTRVGYHLIEMVPVEYGGLPVWMMKHRKQAESGSGDLLSPDRENAR